ncbi:acetate--CoA ligase family protein [Bradyrhizobium sp. STM 3566]|uniref:acetate--CoA ligase family protein n=1 Tax=Bradyrhizobium sp. STM 3566 TaxID=578928 RepID=UPI00388E8C5B
MRLAEGGRGVAIITQSSSIAISMTMQKRSLPIAFLMAAGNQAQSGLSEIALGLIEDDRVTTFGLHIKAFDAVHGFERLAARARELRKPIIAMKVDCSEQSRQATLSHTASLAGSDVASGAFLKGFVIAPVESTPAFIEALKLLHVTGPPPGPRFSSVSCSGGEASVMADGAEGRLVHFPRLTDEHRTSVKSTLGPLIAVAKPLNYHTFIWNNELALTETFTAMVSGGLDLNMMVLEFSRPDRCSNTTYWPIIRAFEAALKTNKDQSAIVSSLPENMPEEYIPGIIERRIAPLKGISEAMQAAEAGAFIGAAWSEPRAEPIDSAAAGRLGGDRLVLEEAEAKEMLLKAGAGAEGRARRQGGRGSDRITGLGIPVALKALGVVHKSEIGAVRLNLCDAESVRAGAHNLLALGTGLYVERMMRDGIAELIVGLVPNPMFGTVMTLGTGGVLVELFGDTVTLMLPATRDDIAAALRGVKLCPLLEGYRGRPKADVPAVI